MPAVLHPFIAAFTAVRSGLSGSLLVVLSTLVAMVVLGLLSLAGNRLAAVALVPVALFWPLIDQQVEGPTLLVLSYSHGVTVADLLCPIALFAALIAFLRPRRHAPHG